MTKEQTLHVVGAGLAGSEAAWQAAERGANVILHEMRPARSPRNPEERSAANTGAVATRTTEDAMLVIASDVIQLAK